MNGRIKCIQDGFHGFISIAPSTIPNGILTLHKTPTSNDEDASDSSININCMQHHTLSSLGIIEIDRTFGYVIIDHCWTIHTRTDDNNDDKDEALLILAKLVQKRSQPITLSQMNESHKSANVSRLFIQWRYCVDGIGSCKGDTIDDNFRHCISINIPYHANSVIMNDDLIVIGTSTGSMIYRISDIIHASSKEDKVQCQHDYFPLVKLMIGFSVHAMDLDKEYFVGVSGDRIGVWHTKCILEKFSDDGIICAAEWDTKICSKRITCIKLFNVEKHIYLALVSWDGAAIIFRKERGDAVWSRFKNDDSKVLDEGTIHDEKQAWEKSMIDNINYRPCLLDMFVYKTNAFLVVSDPKGCSLSSFCIESKSELGRRKDIRLADGDSECKFV